MGVDGCTEAANTAPGLCPGQSAFIGGEGGGGGWGKRVGASHRAYSAETRPEFEMVIYEIAKSAGSAGDSEPVDGIRQG